MDCTRAHHSHSRQMICRKSEEIVCETRYGNYTNEEHSRLFFLFWLFPLLLLGCSSSHLKLASDLPHAQFTIVDFLVCFNERRCLVDGFVLFSFHFFFGVREAFEHFSNDLIGRFYSIDELDQTRKTFDGCLRCILLVELRFSLLLFYSLPIVFCLNEKQKQRRNWLITPNTTAEWSLVDVSSTLSH